MQTVFLYAYFAMAVFFDFLKCKIPNPMIVIGYVAGLVYVCATDSLWYFRITDSLLILAVMYPLFLVGALGGGDVKLITVVSLIIGFVDSINMTIVAFFIGAIISVIKLSYLIYKGEEFRFSYLYIHFSLPIFLGAIITQFFGGILPWQIF